MAKKKSGRGGRTLPLPIAILILVIIIAYPLLTHEGGESDSGTPSSAQSAAPVSSASPVASSAPAQSSTPAAEGEPLIVRCLDVGQGDCILIQYGDEFMLIDSSTKSAMDTVAADLQEYGAQELSLLIATHPHEDHIGCMPTVFKNCTVDTCWMSGFTTTTKTYERLLDGLEENNVETVVPTPGDVFSFGPCTVTCVGPVRESEDNNSNSVVVRMTYGTTAFLFTGDCTDDEEADILEWASANGQPLTADVLKVGHHGSSSSSSDAFLDAVQPRYAMISCGAGNDYGHPHKETMARLDARGIDTYRTDTQGTITAVSDGTTVTVSTQR